MIARKTGSVKLERGLNVVEVPLGYQIIGFDAIGILRLVYDAPANMTGVEKIALHVIRVGDTFEEDDPSAYLVVGMASSLGVRPVIIYQTWNNF